MIHETSGLPSKQIHVESQQIPSVQRSEERCSNIIFQTFNSDLHKPNIAVTVISFPVFFYISSSFSHISRV